LFWFLFQEKPFKGMIWNYIRPLWFCTKKVTFVWINTYTHVRVQFVYINSMHMLRLHQNLSRNHDWLVVSTPWRY
jgi:hypothetical protein